jgi:hypothetical protein
MASNENWEKGCCVLGHCRRWWHTHYSDMSEIDQAVENILTSSGLRLLAGLLQDQLNKHAWVKLSKKSWKVL